MPRKGTKNLIPANRRSKEEAIRNGKKGGIKSGEVRRAKRDMKNEMRMILDLALPPKGKNKTYDRIREALRALGIPDDEMTMRCAIAINAAQMALTSKGVQWAKLAAQMADEMPEDKVSIDADVNTPPQVHIYIPDNGRDGLGTTG